MALLKQFNDEAIAGLGPDINGEAAEAEAQSLTLEAPEIDCSGFGLERELDTIRATILASGGRNRLVNLRESSPFVVNLGGNDPQALFEQLNASEAGVVLRGGASSKQQLPAKPMPERDSELAPANTDVVAGMESTLNGTDLVSSELEGEELSQDFSPPLQVIETAVEREGPSEEELVSEPVNGDSGEPHDSMEGVFSGADAPIVAAYSETALKSNLTKVRNQARLDREEKGIHSLHLVLGFLDWRDEKGVQMRSPLVAVPVSLEQKRGAAYRLKKTDLPLERNEALAVRLREQFGIELPQIRGEETFSFNQYAEDVNKAIKGSGMTLDCKASALATLSFDRVLLHRDLDQNRWPNGRKLEDNPVVNCLFAGGPAPHTAPSYIAPVKSLTETPLVLEADGSQIDAIYRAAWGENLAIEGPPGTGKSQTITNIIAVLVGQGKKVLFVSEKAAAVQVVLEKLQSVGLGDLALDLHSEDLSRGRVIDSLRSAVQQRSPQDVDLGAVKNKVRKLEAILSNHEILVSKPIGDRNISLHEAVGEMARLSAVQGATWLDLSQAGVAALSGERYQKSVALSNELVAILNHAGGLECHPLFESDASLEVLEHKKGEHRNALRASTATMERAQADIAEFCQKFKLTRDAGIAELKQVVAALSELHKAEKTMGAAVLVVSRHDEWAERLKKLEEYGKLVKAEQAIRAKWSDRLRDEAWVCPSIPSVRSGLDQLLSRLTPTWRHLLSPSMWILKRSIKALYRDGQCPAPKQWGEALEAIGVVQRLKKAIDSPDRQSLFEGGELQRAKDDVSTLSSIVDFSTQFLSKFSGGSRFAELVAFMHTKEPGERDAVYQLLGKAEQALDTIEEGIRACARITGLNGDAEASASQAASVGYSVDRCKELTERYSDINTVVSVNRILADMRRLGVSITKNDLTGWKTGVQDLSRSLQRTWLDAVIAEHVTSTSQVQARGEVLGTAANQYFAAAQELFAANAQMIARVHWKQMPSQLRSGQAKIIGNEIQKRGKHLPIRTLMQEAGAAVQAIKPVVFASPASVARFISPDSPVEFDVVIIDEASQMRPSDALGSLGRARQAVIVGDLNQMPPTRMFEARTDAHVASRCSSAESILALAMQGGITKVMLNHHRRSMDPSLISMASKLLYGGSLLAFPSPRVGALDEGLTFRKIDNATYDRGGKSTNQVEAEAVVQAAVEHIHVHPERSLGIVAFNKNQAQLIQKLIQEELQKDPSLKRSLMDNHNGQPLFVRSLENVQGDERDTIFVSVGFAPDDKGKFTFNFGPLAETGGERRLNVLMTRARWECRLFSSIDPEKLGGDERALGVQHLRRYLEVARDKREARSAVSMDDRQETGAQELVRRALEEKGYVVETSLGEDGVVLDLAVKSREMPNRYLAGILFDAAEGRNTLPGTLKAERLTWIPAELQQRGWRVLTVWTRDLMTNCQSTIDALVRSLDQELQREQDTIAAPVGVARAAVRTIRRDLAVGSAGDVRSNASLVVPFKEFTPAWPAAVSLQTAQPKTVAKVLAEVVAAEFPIHREEAFARLLNGSRPALKLEERFVDGLKSALEQRLVIQVGQFLYKPGGRDGAVPIRQRTRSAAKSSTLEWVSPEELVAAMDLVVRDSCGIKRGEIGSHVMAMLGVKDVSPQAATRLSAELEQQLASNRYECRAEWIILGSKS